MANLVLIIVAILGGHSIYLLSLLLFLTSTIKRIEISWKEVE